MADAIVNLVIVAHPDDEILGVGGTGAKFVARGEIVQPVILCGNVDARTRRPDDLALTEDIRKAADIVGFRHPVLGDFPNIRFNTVPHLDIVKFIETQIDAFQPKRIFTHHASDLNDDHGYVTHGTLAAARLFQRKSIKGPLQSIHLMEVLSATDWAFPDERDSFRPNEFVEISGFLEKKISALRAFRNVMRDFPHPRSPEVITGLAALRGGQCGLGYAEAFQTVFSTRMN
jgi:N-acetylglucosamine malate deacetylase 1